jgi:DNA polymerase-3 subunit epsilon
VAKKPDGTEQRWSTLVNPTIPIPPDSTAVHGITDEMVRGCRICGCGAGDTDAHAMLGDNPHTFAPWPTFADLAANLVLGFTNCDFAGYNVRFDLRVLSFEFDRLRVDWSYADARVVDGHRLRQIVSPRTLSDAVRELLGREPTSAHDAVGDVQDALDVIEWLLAHHEQLPRDLGALHLLQWPESDRRIDVDGKFVWGDDGEAVINFGKYKDTRLRDLDKGFLRWMIKPEQTFPRAVKHIAWNAIKGIYPVRDLPTS